MGKDGEGGNKSDRQTGEARLARTASSADRRRERLAAELRANLLKRKAQARSRTAASSPDENGSNTA